jgi:heme-degrading monooxygenase HmoA
MLIKWIRCNVFEDQKPMFSIAQQQWKALTGFQGFVGQIGGWNNKNPFEACILSFWKDESSYQAFMNQKHDEIFEKSNQQTTYYNIFVELYKTEAVMDKETQNVTEILRESKALHVRECILKKQRDIESLQDERHGEKQMWFRHRNQYDRFLIISRSDVLQCGEHDDTSAMKDVLVIRETVVVLEDLWAVF